MRHTEILVTRNGGDFEQKGREREENQWLLSLTLKERRFGMNQGFSQAQDLVGFSAYGLKIQNSKKKKKNCKREVLGFEPELIGKKYTKLPP